MVEEFEPRVLYRLGNNVILVGIAFQPRGTPAVHMHNHLHLGTKDDFLRIGDAVTGKAVYREQLGRQIILLHQVTEITGGIVNVIGIIGADFGAREVCRS